MERWQAIRKRTRDSTLFVSFMRYRFSDLKVKVNIIKQSLVLPDSVHDLGDGDSINVGVGKVGFQDSAFPVGKDVRSHGFPIAGKTINTFLPYSREHQVCDPDKGTKNLNATEQKQTVAGELQKTTQQNVKGKIVEFGFWLQKQGYQSAKNRLNMIKRLVDLGVDLQDPESVKAVLAKGRNEKTNKKWKDGYKMLMMYAYENFLKMEGLTWQRPRYKQERTLPFIPTEQELDQLIGGVGKKIGTFLQGLKDTGADPGELAKLKWVDLNTQTGTVNITPVKGHLPRILKVSGEFIRRITAFTNKSEYIFNHQSLNSSYAKARKRLAHKLNNPRLLKISFTTFRHWKGTTEYHKTKDILHVKQLLGHKNIQSTMVYINLEAAIFTDRNDEFHVVVAKNTQEACKIVKVGFEYVTGEYEDGGKIFRKRK
jgi:integrase